MFLPALPWPCVTRDVLLILIANVKSFFSFVFLVASNETVTFVEYQFRIMTAVLRNKVQKQLNISANTKSFSPMFNFGSSVHASVALEHFNLGFVEVRRF